MTVIEPAAIWILRELGYDPEALGQGEAQDRSLMGKQVTLDDLKDFLVLVGLARPGQEVQSLPSWPVWVRNRQVLSTNGTIWDYTDSLDGLRALEVPILAVKGTDTAPHLAAIVDDIVATTPHTRLLVLPGGHACHLENPDRFLQALIRHATRALAGLPSDALG